jgi:hypothetical protein
MDLWRPALLARPDPEASLAPPAISGVPGKRPLSCRYAVLDWRAPAPTVIVVAVTLDPPRTPPPNFLELVKGMTMNLQTNASG